MHRGHAHAAALGAAVALAVAASPTAAWAESPPGAVLFGVEHSRGALDELRGERLVQWSLGLRWRAQQWTFGIELPWLQRRDADGRAEGASDLVLRASHELRALQHDQTGLDLTLKIKTASGSAAQGLSTGAPDALLQLEATRLVAAGVLASAEVGYRVTGNVAGAKPYANVWHVELGLQSPWRAQTAFGALAHARQAVTSAGPRAEATLYAQRRWGDHTLRVHLLRGNGRGSPERALGLTWIAGFG